MRAWSPVIIMVWRRVTQRWIGASSHQRGDQRVEDAPVDDAAVHVLGARERATFQQHDRAAGPGQLDGSGRTGGSGTDDDGVDS